MIKIETSKRRTIKSNKCHANVLQLLSVGAEAFHSIPEKTKFQKTKDHIKRSGDKTVGRPKCERIMYLRGKENVQEMRSQIVKIKSMGWSFDMVITRNDHLVRHSSSF